MVAVRRTLEETSLVKILIVYEKLSEAFYSYSLGMEAKTQSLLNILFNTLRNPLCTRDALKTLILSTRIQDTRLLVGELQPDLDSAEELEEADADLLEGVQAAELSEARAKQAVGKVELMRLLYLLPYFMQQFLAPLGEGQQRQQDQLFQNKRNMIQLLKKSLPSIGINKKSAIFERLEVIQRKTANQQVELTEDESRLSEHKELTEEFEALIQDTVSLIRTEGFKSSLVDALSTFKRLSEHQRSRYGQDGQIEPGEAEKKAKDASD